MFTSNKIPLPKLYICLSEIGCENILHIIVLIVTLVIVILLRLKEQLCWQLLEFFVGCVGIIVHVCVIFSFVWKTKTVGMYSLMDKKSSEGICKLRTKSSSLSTTYPECMCKEPSATKNCYSMNSVEKNLVRLKDAC